MKRNFHYMMDCRVRISKHFLQRFDNCQIIFQVHHQTNVTDGTHTSFKGISYYTMNSEMVLLGRLELEFGKFD